MLTKLTCTTIAFLCLGLQAVAQMSRKTTSSTKSSYHLHLEIAVPTYPPDSPMQPHVSAKNVMLTAQNHRILVQRSSNFQTHLLVLFASKTDRPTDVSLIKMIAKVFKVGWQVSVARANGCPTSYAISEQQIEDELSQSATCDPDRTLQQLATFAGRRVVFLVGSDQDTLEMYSDARKRNIPFIYLVDGGIKTDFSPTESDPGYNSHSPVQVQTINGGAQYGLINEVDIQQALNDAVHAAANFYDFILSSTVPINGPIQLSFRNFNGSGNAQLYTEKVIYSDAHSLLTRDISHVTLILDTRHSKTLSQNPVGLNEAGNPH
jgi:hypothetical protein